MSNIHISYAPTFLQDFIVTQENEKREVFFRGRVPLAPVSALPHRLRFSISAPACALFRTGARAAARPSKAHEIK